MSQIAMVVFSYYPADPRVRREAEALSRAGMNVDVIALRAPKEPRVEQLGRITTYRVMQGTENKESFVKYLRLSAAFAVLAFFKLQILSLQKNRKLIQIHNMPDFLVFAGVAHKVFGKPLILDLHDLTPELFKSKWSAEKNGALMQTARLAEKISCGFADHLITTSAGFQKQLVARGIPPAKITLVLNTADDHVFKTQSQRQWIKIEKSARLLYHGTVARRFGLHIAIEAVHRLRKTIPEAQLRIYGKYDPTYRRELENLIAQFGLQDRVRLCGFLHQEEIVKIIESSDLGIVPYLSDPFMDLALSTKTFEYVNMRLPTVASKLPSLTALFDDESIKYFAPGNAADLADKIAAFCGDPEARQSYTERAATAYQKIAWPVMAERYRRLIQDLMVNGKDKSV
jgi:glycosyltransferase involved in cell wall biosynthesis